MATFFTRIASIYTSDTAFVSGFLLAVGLVGATAGMWVRFIA
jgi:hypothetical protein